MQLQILAQKSTVEASSLDRRVRGKEMARVAANSPAAIGLRRQRPAKDQALALANTKKLPTMCQKTRDRRKFEKTAAGD